MRRRREHRLASARAFQMGKEDFSALSPMQNLALGVSAGTIEERIMKLQEKKKLIFEGTVGQSTEALGRLTEDDLRFLFA